MRRNIEVCPAPVLDTFPDITGKFFVCDDPTGRGDLGITKYLGHDGLWYKCMATGQGHYFDTEEEAQAAMEKVT